MPVISVPKELIVSFETAVAMLELSEMFEVGQEK